ncbi:hypothetical protein GN956_G8009 [Arapaima gigas]
MLRACGFALYPSDRSPIPAEPASLQTEPDSPVCALSPPKTLEDGDFMGTDLQKTRTALLQPKSAKGYLGVRVRMPVRDMLRKIRIAKGIDPLALPVIHLIYVLISTFYYFLTGEKKRVHSSGACRSKLNKKQMQSLEDLSIIVEVLEEDLKASKPNEHSRETLSTSLFSGCQTGSRAENSLFQDQFLKCEQEPKSLFPEKHCISPVLSVACPFTPSPWSTEDVAPSLRMWGDCYTGNVEDGFSSTHPLTAFSNKNTEWQEFSPHNTLSYNRPYHSEGRSKEKGWERREDWSHDLAKDWDGNSFFWLQLQKEEMLLRTVSDDDLLAVDNKGRTLLHSAVAQGKRALVLVIAKRMAALNQIDIRDREGKTALHLSAQRNQHLMVADLLLLGANVNMRDKSGKTCLHLSAENGYVRVVEVLRHSINSGMYVDVDAADMNGLNALQCAIATLNTCKWELERSTNTSLVRLYTLRQEQLLDTLDCLLHMGSCLQGLENLTCEAQTACCLLCTTYSEHNLEVNPHNVSAMQGSAVN